MTDTSPSFPLVPLFDHLIIKRDEAKAQVGGVIIPESAKEPPAIGTVLAAGEGRLCTELAKSNYEHESGKGYLCGGCHVEPLRIKVGDRVLFQSYAGTEVSVPPHGKLLIMREDDIIAVILQE